MVGAYNWHGKMRNAKKILLRESEVKTVRNTEEYIWEHNKMNLQEIQW